MADLTITITNRLGVYGPAMANRWNAHNWNAFDWAEGAPVGVPVGVEKFITSTFLPTSTAAKAVDHLLFDGLTLSDDVLLDFSRSISNAVSVTSSVHSLFLTDRSGYNYNFPDRTADGQERDFTTWADGSDASTPWTPPTTPSTSWSDA